MELLYYTTKAKANCINRSQLESLYALAEKLNFYDKLENLPPAADYHFQAIGDVIQRWDGRFHPSKLFLGESDTHQLWAVVKLHDNRAAWVYIIEEEIATGTAHQVNTPFHQTTNLSGFPFMMPFKGVADKASELSSGCDLLKAFIKYVYIDTGTAGKLFGDAATAFDYLRKALNIIADAYKANGGKTPPLYEYRSGIRTDKPRDRKRARPREAFLHH